jgi:CDP-diacylglycerol--glycerol-3-phosphate 3-phosphatidyltransferase
MECDYYMSSLVLFIIGAGTDWVDGYFARKYGQVTTLGRILDPFADKVIVCGTFIFLAANPVMVKVSMGLRAWMVVVIVGRELLVTALRSFIEERGGDFSANWSGKIKMVLQCFAAGVCLFYLTYASPLENAPQWCWVLLVASVWSAVISTVYSGAVYIREAIKMLGNK